MAGPLAEGYRILDLSERSPAAAVAGMVLADLGAEVIRVEPQGGDPVRVLAGSRVWLRGQKSVTIGPAEVESGRWRALRESADVILTTVQPWTAKPAGLLDGYPTNQRQIIALLTAYPRTAAEVKYPHDGIDAPVCGEIVEAQYGCMNARRDGGKARFFWAGRTRFSAPRGSCSSGSSALCSSASAPAMARF